MEPRSTVRGVLWDKTNKTWIAELTVKGRKYRKASIDMEKAEQLRADLEVEHLGAVQGRGRLNIHGKAKTPVYEAWREMIARCHDPRNPAYKWYGARGIAVCERWRKNFADFAEDMGERPDGLSIDRVNNDGNYEPGNCRWATATEQARNKRPRQKRTHLSTALGAKGKSC